MQLSTFVNILQEAQLKCMPCYWGSANETHKKTTNKRSKNLARWYRFCHSA